MQQPGRLVLGLTVVHVDSDQEAYLIKVRGDEGGAGSQARTDRLERLVRQQLVAPCRRGDRVDHQRDRPVPTDPEAVADRHDCLDDGGVRKHASLHRVQPDVSDNRLDLGSHGRRRYWMHGTDSQ
jgi:hypothetical protein